MNLDGLGIQLTAPSKRRYPTTRLYSAPLTDRDIAQCRRAAGLKETTTMTTIGTAKTDPAPAVPVEDEHSYPVEPVRYCVEREGDEPEWLTLPEIIAADSGLSRATIDAIRLLSPGEEASDHASGVVVTRPKRVRVVVAFEIDACDAPDARKAVEDMLDDSEAEQYINTYRDSHDILPLQVVDSSVVSSEVQS